MPNINSPVKNLSFDGLADAGGMSSGSGVRKSSLRKSGSGEPPEKKGRGDSLEEDRSRSPVGGGRTDEKGEDSMSDDVEVSEVVPEMPEGGLGKGGKEGGKEKEGSGDLVAPPPGIPG